MKHFALAIDAMSGDRGVKAVVPAVLRALRRNPTLKIFLVGDTALLEKRLLNKPRELTERIELVHSTEVVGMDEPPAQALRGKKQSSMRLAINLVKEGRAQAAVSAGNTGALMATAKFVLKTIPGIDRPAIVARFPTVSGDEVRVLDLGANVEVSSEMLYQFAVMGSVLTNCVTGKNRPKVGLLNVGEEEIKGNELVKQTAELLIERNAVNYCGYVEGDAIYKGDVDVVVCDGFVGNIMLKNAEGLAKYIKTVFRREFKKNWFTSFLGLLAYPVIKQIMNILSTKKRNGATFLGLNGIVMKSHGSADKVAFYFAINEAIRAVENDIPSLIRDRVAAIMEESA